MAGARAGELIAPWALAMNEGLDIGAMARFVAPYPTLGEVGQRAAMSFFPNVPPLEKASRLFGWLRRR
jgi:hypothetical protein